MLTNSSLKELRYTLSYGVLAWYNLNDAIYSLVGIYTHMTAGELGSRHEVRQGKK